MLDFSDGGAPEISGCTTNDKNARLDRHLLKGAHSIIHQIDTIRTSLVSHLRVAPRTLVSKHKDVAFSFQRMLVDVHVVVLKVKESIRSTPS